MKSIFISKRTEKLDNDLIEDKLGKKVNSIPSKGLSTNDFSDEYKDKIDINSKKVSFPEAPNDNLDYVRHGNTWKSTTGYVKGNVNLIISKEAPTNPSINDVWIDIS